ncbi:ATPase [Streptomyces sp. MUM 203J]|nr:ATPase [Streptomyces sp. MUM 203J]
MRRVAVVVPDTSLREALVLLAEMGSVEIDTPGPGAGGQGPAARRLQRLRTAPGRAALSARLPGLDALEAVGRTDLLAGEARLEQLAEGAVRRGSVAALVGWCPASRVEETAGGLAPAGAALVGLAAPKGVDPPTALRAAGPLRRSFRYVVGGYGTVAYTDLDPTVPAGLAFIAMFGMMFGDAGHGIVLVVCALLLRLGVPRKAAVLRPLWPFLAGAGAAATLAGLAYGEFFGPTGVLPVLWLSPVEDPVRLLFAAVVTGAVLLLATSLAATVNRWRGSGPAGALYAPTGVAGTAVLVGLPALAAGLWLGPALLTAVGGVLLGGGLLLAGAGLYAQSAGGAAGTAETGVRLLDLVMRTFSNLVSFARLAAFGLTHAALGALIWDGTTALGGRGAPGLVAAAALFAVGNAVAFALEALVAGVQALRLEYYELFSRLFDGQGRPFSPWRLPVDRSEVVS